MIVHLAYGKTGIDVEIPDANLQSVLTMRDVPAVANPARALTQLLGSPMGGAALADRARHAASACIVVCDITRPVPNRILLPPILAALGEGGIQRERITILVATGLHRPSTQDELLAMLGDEIVRTTRIVNHRARVKDEQRSLGTTRQGTPVCIDEEYCAADLKVTTGFIEPHLMAGFSGGRKLIAPGCAGEETIKALHSPQFIEHPMCREGSIEGNPLHEELLTIARMAGHDMIVNVALDAERRITGVFAGDPEEAHARGVSHVRSAATATVPSPVDMVITSSAGHPLDLTLYQAVKGMTAAVPILKPGGTLIIAAECAEGLGSPEFTAMATASTTARGFLDELRRVPVRIDQWQLEECAKVAVGHECVLVSSGIPEDQRRRLFIRTAPTLDDAVREGIRRHGSGARIAVIPKGPYTLVRLQSP